MKFWDSSALVPLLLAEDASNVAGQEFREDSIVVVSWTTVVECASAIARAEREELLGPAGVKEAFARLDELARLWREVEPTNGQRDIARRLLRVHRLRAADALQLAAATLAAERRPDTLTFVTLDERLENAALKEGFAVLVPGRAA